MESTDDGFPASQFDKAFKCIEAANIGNKVYKLGFHLSGNEDQVNSIFNSMKKGFIPNVEWIRLSNWNSSCNELIVKCMNQMTFESLKVFEYFDVDGVSDENMQLLQLNKILDIAFDKLTKS